MRQPRLYSDTRFECDIRFMQHLDVCWLTWFEGLLVNYLPEGETRVTGIVTDQAALFGLLNKIRDLNVKVVTFNIQALKA
jgi:hypothetical protein